MILYFGNILSRHGYTPTFIETLAPKLQERYKVITASDQQNLLMRLSHMKWVFFKHLFSSRLILIDSYSKKAFWYTVMLALLSQMFGKKYVPIIRGGDYESRLKSHPGWCRWIFKRAYRIISPSLFLQNTFRQYGYEIDYIPNFLPLDNYTFQERETIAPKLLWVRSFHQIYNPALAVQILAKLKEKYPDAKLCMVGPAKDKSLEETQEVAKELKLDHDITFTGKLSKPEWLNLSAQYDIFINTTSFDNHPVSVIEAMALGLPVVSSKVGGLPFLVDDNQDGLLVTPLTSEAFVEKIETLLNDAIFARQIAEKARAKAASFDWHEVKKKWFELIDDVV